MKKLSLSLLLIIQIISAQYVIGQSNTAQIWDALNQNDRNTALKLVNKIDCTKANMEELVVREIVRNQSGLLLKDDCFLDNFIQQANFEPYLYPLWKSYFLFKDYLSLGFEKDNIDAIKLVSQLDLKDPTLKAAILYLEGIAARNENDFDTQRANDIKISAITDWAICGVFENLNNSGFDMDYAPEKTAFSKEDFNANSNGYVNWYVPDYKVNTAYQFLSNNTEYGRGINYLQSFFNLENDRDLIFKLGTSGKIKIWINDILIFEESEEHETELDAHSFSIKIPKGHNRILVKTTNSNSSYFILRVFDNKDVLLNPKELGFTSKYSPYNKGDKTKLSIKPLPNIFESYFSHLEQENYSPFFKDYLLAETYLRNNKEQEAKNILNKYLDKYPKSSFIKEKLIKCYEIEGDYNKSKEFRENIKNDDKNKSSVLIEAVGNTNKLFKKPIEEMFEELDKVSECTDNVTVKNATVLLKLLREDNKQALKKNMDVFYAHADSMKQLNMLIPYSNFYKNVFNDNDKNLYLLEQINDKFLSYGVHNSLRNIYKKRNLPEKVLALDKDFVNNFPDDLKVLTTYIEDLYKYQKYKESMPFIDRGLSLFPYSFKLMRKKAKVYTQLNDDKSALVWYKKSFTHNSANSSVRKKIQDLEKTKDPFKEFELKTPYEYIAKNRKITKTEINYGINIIYDEKNVQIFKEGGNRGHSIYVYEVTSEDGVEALKEYDLGLGYGATINKSEIIKPDGSIVPAEKSGSKFVFNSLAIGDVVYIDFETFSNTSGRFYKDYTDFYQFENYYPSLKTIYRLFSAKGEPLYYKVNNGDLKLSKSQFENYDVYEWQRENSQILDAFEPYMPADCDIATTLHISTIKNWSTISNWYSDLVRTKIKENSTVDKTFNDLFPDGYKQFNEETIARKIYYFMTNNLTYSFVNFKQSGFVPQEPSKTLTSLLGDCKDFSTLFLTLARKAGLEANLVLVSTSDLGRSNLILANTDFNHCIIKASIDGHERYIELTDKYLPFGSTPQSLVNALALNIPYLSSEANHNKLFILDENLITHNTKDVSIDIKINDGHKDLKITHRSLNANSYYRSLISEKNSIQLKKNIEELYEGSSKLDLNLIDYKIDKNIKEDPEIIFTVNFETDADVKKIGKIKLLQLPIFSRPYTNDIINLEERKYPIEYNNYENVDIYTINYNVSLANGEKFIEVPDNVTYTYKKHKYTLAYNLDKDDTVLKISIVANIDKSNIQTKDYPGFKKFVKDVLSSNENFIGYK